jgi:CRP/FNR family transcriptional regulator, cyclic AMP receptor protein
VRPPAGGRYHESRRANINLLTVLAPASLEFGMDKDQAEKIMTGTGWLSRQPPDFQKDVLGRSLLRRHRAGKVLYDVDDDGSGVFGLVEGVLEVQLPNGQIATVGTPGFWIGEAAAFRRAPRRAALVAKSEVWILYLPLAEFEVLITNAAYCRCFAHLTIEHLEDALRVVASLMPNDVVARVSGRLLSLSTAHAAPGVALTVTQADLASMCGLSRQSVNKSLRRLIEAGAVASSYGKVSVVDPARLRH